MSKTILVIGGTGRQGHGFIDHVQQSNSLHKLKIITRYSHSNEAKALTARGVEVLNGSLFDESFLAYALKNVDVLYINTFSDHDGTEVLTHDDVYFIVSCSVHK